LILKRNVAMKDDGGIGGFAASFPMLALLNEKATVELWRLDPKPELIARWQPYGGKPVADLGFAGDTLYFRSDEKTTIDLIPLTGLNRRLKDLGLNW
jgi:hypothetical protein